MRICGHMYDRKSKPEVLAGGPVPMLDVAASLTIFFSTPDLFS